MTNKIIKWECHLVALCCGLDLYSEKCSGDKSLFLLNIVIQCGTIYLTKGEIIMSTITVRLNSEEARIYKEYAEFKNIPLSTLMKEALEEKIEDEIDLKAILSYEERLKNDEVEYISFDEVKKRLEI